MKSLLDPSFQYVPSNKTSVAETFARVRREMLDAKEKAKQNEREIESKVKPLIKVKA